MGTGIAPASKVPAKVQKKSALVGSMIATASPGEIPRRASSAATAEARANNSPQVMVRSLPSSLYK